MKLCHSIGIWCVKIVQFCFQLVRFLSEQKYKFGNYTKKVNLYDKKQKAKTKNKRKKWFEKKKSSDNTRDLRSKLNLNTYPKKCANLFLWTNKIQTYTFFWLKIPIGKFYIWKHLIKGVTKSCYSKIVYSFNAIIISTCCPSIQKVRDFIIEYFCYCQNHRCRWN